MKPTIYTMQTAKVESAGYMPIRHQSQAEHCFILDDLVEVGPLNVNSHDSSATLVLTFNRQHSPKSTVLFPFYAVGQTAREKLVADWHDFLEQRYTMPPELRKALDEHRLVSAEALQTREAEQ